MLKRMGSKQTNFIMIAGPIAKHLSTFSRLITSSTPSVTSPLRNKDLIILEKEMRKSSDEVIIMTDDGSYGRKGLVHDDNFVGAFAHFFFENDKVFITSCQYSDHTVAGSWKKLSNARKWINASLSALLS